MFMVSSTSSKEKLMLKRSLPPCLDWVSVLFFAGKVGGRTFETGVASSECNTGVSLLWLSLDSTVCVVLSLFELFYHCLSCGKLC